MALPAPASPHRPSARRPSPSCLDSHLLVRGRGSAVGRRVRNGARGGADSAGRGPGLPLAVQHPDPRPRHDGAYGDAHTTTLILVAALAALVATLLLFD